MKLSHLKSIVARISAIFLFIILAWGCGRVPKLTDVAPPAARLPFVRVLLSDDATRHEISTTGRDQMAIDCYKNEDRTSYYSRKPVIVNGSGRTLELYDSDGMFLDDNIDKVILSARGKKRILTYDGKQYRGLMELSSSSGQVRLINVVYMEDYLKGVVPLEIGPTPDEQIESVKAQAVAARTYSMSHLGQYGLDEGYDLKADISDQIYGGVSVENEDFNEAIEDTRGLVTIYKDKMIDAYYHSTCGGTTDDIEDVWEKDAAPYLVTIKDDDACNISKYFSWQERFTADQLLLRLEQYLTQERGNRFKLDKLTDIQITNRTPGGRVGTIVFETTGGHYIFRKEKVRWVLRRSDNTDAIMRSANFTLDIKRNSEGEIVEVYFNGRGYGHGVGMCQMGAKGLAAKGVTFDSILALYYQGTELKKLY
jgi:stage II sporulation protein D